jgi:hypothetical protein
MRYMSFIQFHRPRQTRSKCQLHFNFPGIVIDTKENTDDQFKIDKVLTFNDFNIILKAGKLYFTQHDGDGDKFTK